MLWNFAQLLLIELSKELFVIFTKNVKIELFHVYTIFTFFNIFNYDKYFFNKFANCKLKLLLLINQIFIIQHTLESFFCPPRIPASRVEFRKTCFAILFSKNMLCHFVFQKHNFYHILYKIRIINIIMYRFFVLCIVFSNQFLSKVRHDFKASKVD